MNTDVRFCSFSDPDMWSEVFKCSIRDPMVVCMLFNSSMKSVVHFILSKHCQQMEILILTKQMSISQ
jgi:hypothetical protein